VGDRAKEARRRASGRLLAETGAVAALPLLLVAGLASNWCGQ